MRALDNTKETYGFVLETINSNTEQRNRTVSMDNTFSLCANLVSFEEGFSIPDGVHHMLDTFYGCTSLVRLPDSFSIPNTVRVMNSTFYGCTSLSTLPEGFTIPSGMININAIFGGCSALEATVIINANPKMYSDCFEGVKHLNLTGTSTMLNTLAEPYKIDGNVTVIVQ